MDNLKETFKLQIPSDALMNTNASANGDDGSNGDNDPDDFLDNSQLPRGVQKPKSNPVKEEELINEEQEKNRAARDEHYKRIIEMQQNNEFMSEDEMVPNEEIDYSHDNEEPDYEP